MKIDATNRPLGRLASQIAMTLQGKDRATFRAESAGEEVVEVENITKMKITGKKMKDKIYYRYSGYPGGLKEITLGELFAKDPGEVLRKAVLGMLPKNKLRKSRIKRLIVK